MRKEYKKPIIIFEKFSLSTSISAGCELITSLPRQNDCGVQYGASVLFTQSVTGCVSGYENLTGFPVSTDTAEYNGFCYHNPPDDKNLFASA